MDTLIEQLIGILSQSERLYAKLLPVIDDEKDAALTSNLSGLESTAAEKAEIFARLHRAEQQRQQLLSQIAAKLKVPTRDVSLSFLANHVQTRNAETLKRLDKSLKTLLPKIRHANEESRRLIRHCLQLVQNSLVFLHRWIGSSAIYSVSGTIDNEAYGGRIMSGSV